MMLRTKCLGYLASIAVGIALCADFGMAANTPFGNKKVIEFIVCTKVGGVYDTEARLIAPYLQKELPGSKVIVRNVPGGGHIVGANRVWGAKPDGLTIAIANVPGLIAAQIRGEQGIRFDLRKFTWIGRLYTNHRFLIARKNAGFDSIESFLKGDKEFKVGTEGVGSGPYNTGLLMAEALGLKKVRMITGYGGGDKIMGLVRKEIEGVIGGLDFWTGSITEGEAAPLLTYDAKRYAPFPNVPTLGELVKTQKGKAVASYISGESELSRSLFAPPNMPADIAKRLRTAFTKALQDENFKKLVDKMGREPFDPLPGEEVAKKVSAALNLTPDVAGLIKQVAKEL
jgi:tripartite-type tricarboxylate transporter receptor subunit TctC